MHQDKKVGLALALLVIGFVAAFCLRQDRNTRITSTSRLPIRIALPIWIHSQKKQLKHNWEVIRLLHR